MRFIWTLIKVALAVAIVVPLCIIALGVGMGILGALFGIAVLVLKLGVLALVGYGVFKLASKLFGGPKRPSPPPVKQLPTYDPHYEAAMRELDRELGEIPRK
jgi:hypothetical protein